MNTPTDKKVFTRATVCAVLLFLVFLFHVKEASPTQPQQSPFCIVVLPDTQHYTRRFTHIFIEQTEWIAENREKMNIAAVIHLGDITDSNSRAEWEAAARAFDVLEGKIPLCLAAGNHDTGPEGKRSTLETEMLDVFFPPEKLETTPWFGGMFEKHSIKNAYYIIDAGGVQFIVMCLEFGPRDAVLEWAGEILEKHHDKTAIIVTHCYLNYDSTRVGDNDAYNPHRYPHGGNDGEEIWDKLIRVLPNVSFVLSGHVGGDGTGRQTSRSDSGNLVHEMVSNYQLRRSGGNGWLRIMQFVPEENRVYIQTYSPYLDRYDKRKKNNFSVEFHM
jgi:predicted MPP superfamily phosphohydrolase